jgi:choice-of-anchor B domain-containing protein
MIKKGRDSKIYYHLKFKIILLIFLVSYSISFSQSQNVNLVGNMNDYPDEGYSDIWGYTAPNGDEYALLGINGGISIIDLSDTSNIAEVEFISWVTADPYGWYDMKTYRNYMYVSSEGSQEILIVDLSNLPESASVVGSYSGLSSAAHNIYIDTTSAVLYIVEDFNWDPSVRIVSLANPESPSLLSTIHPGINGMDVHDVYARDGILYIAEGDDPSIGLFDVSDPSNPTLITRVIVPAAGYVHQVWVSEDNNYMITTEETPDKTIKIWDLQNLDNIEMISEYLGENRFAHNAYIHNGYIYISHYTSGLKVLDFSTPSDIREIGFFDTYPQSEEPIGDGAWGVFPFLESELILISDMSTGLYVLKFEREQGPQIVTSDLDFGSILVGESSDTLYVKLTNFGTEILTITSISTSEGSFTFNDIPEVPVNLDPGESTTFASIFSPTSEGEVEDIITIGSNDANDMSIEISLTGYGLVINPAEDSIIYAGTGFPNPGKFITIDPVTGKGTLIGESNIMNTTWGFIGEIFGLTINSKNEIYCCLYYSSDIYKLDAVSGNAVLVVDTDLDLTNIIFGSNDILYATSVNDNDLYTIDLISGKSTSLGSFLFFTFAMAFDPISADLFVSSWPDEITRIDINSLSTSSVGSTGLESGISGIHFDNQGNLFGVEGFNEISDYISISRVDGTANIIGSTGFSIVEGISTKIDTFWHVKPQSISLNKKTQVPGIDTLKIESHISNPDYHQIYTEALIENHDFSISDTVQLFDDGLHQDSSAGDNIFGGSWPVKSGQGILKVRVNAFPSQLGHVNNFLSQPKRFTTGGPVVFNDYTITSEDTIPNPGDLLVYNIALRNESLTDTVINIKAKVISLDTCALVRGSDREYNNIAPGEVSAPTQGIALSFAENCPPGSGIDFAVNILSDGYLFWSDTFTVYVDSTVSSIVNRDSRIPTTYALDKNYPNPFNPTTTIGYQLPFASDVELSIYNLLGQKVATLVSKQQSVGYYQVNWDASGFASGIYYYRIEAHATHSKQERPFIQTKKLILVK